MTDECDQQVHPGIDPEQAQFWASLGGRPLTVADTEPYGVEFVTDLQRLAELNRRYPCPTAIDVGQGVFGIYAGRLFIDDDTGRAIAYAPPELRQNQRAVITERRRQGLCPVCGDHIRLVGNTTDGRHIGSCGDAFLPIQWRRLGPRTPHRTAQSARGRRHHGRIRIKLLLIGEIEVGGDNPYVRALARLDAFREAVQPAGEYGLALYEATVADLAPCRSCDHMRVQHAHDDGPCIVAGCRCEQFPSGPSVAPGAPE